MRRTPTTRVGTWNAYQRSNNAKARPALIEFAKQVDVAGLQEFGGAERRQMLVELRLLGYDFYKPKDHPSAPAVFWDTTRFEFLRGHPLLLAEGRDTGLIPGKRSHLDDLYGTVVVLLDKKRGVEIAVGNLHAPSHIEFWPGPRRKMNKEALHAILHDPEIAKHNEAYIVGDFNWSLDKPRTTPRKVMRGSGFHVCWASHTPKHPTEGKRVIDGIFAKRKYADRADVLAEFTVGDHKPVVAWYA